MSSSHLVIEWYWNTHRIHLNIGRIDPQLQHWLRISVSSDKWLGLESAKPQSMPTVRPTVRKMPKTKNDLRTYEHNKTALRRKSRSIYLQIDQSDTQPAARRWRRAGSVLCRSQHRKYVLLYANHATCSTPTRQHELDHTEHTDQGSIYLPWKI